MTGFTSLLDRERCGETVTWGRLRCVRMWADLFERAFYKMPMFKVADVSVVPRLLVIAVLDKIVLHIIDE